MVASGCHWEGAVAFGFTCIMFRHSLFLPSLAAVLCISILSAAFLVAKNSHRIFSSAASDIEVTGSTSQDFVSDLAVWQGDFYRQANDLKEAYALMKADKEVVRAFLLEQGIPGTDFAFLAIDIDQKFKSVPQFNDEGDLVHREQVFDGYRLKRGFKVTSSDIDLIERISQDVTELIEQNVYITSYPPKYFYTQLGELKIQMIAAASADGQLRARTAVQGGGGDLGDLLETSIGVFQILGTNSDESFSWGGTLNTSSKQKTAFVNVKQRYAIE